MTKINCMELIENTVLIRSSDRRCTDRFRYANDKANCMWRKEVSNMATDDSAQPSRARAGMQKVCGAALRWPKKKTSSDQNKILTGCGSSHWRRCGLEVRSMKRKSRLAE